MGDSGTSKKVQRKHVLITNSELVKKRIAVSKYNKFQLWIAKVFKLELKDRYQYLYRIAYKGTTRLKNNDIVCNTDGVIFVVVKEESRLAMIVSKDFFGEKPSVRGKLIIIDK